MEEKNQWSDRQLGSSCCAAGLTETSNRSVVSCQDCYIQELCVPAGNGRQSERLNASYKNQYFVSCLLSFGRPVVAWRTPVLLFTCSPAHNQQARPSALSTGATQTAQQTPHWFFNILGQKLTCITLFTIHSVPRSEHFPSRLYKPVS